MSNMSEQDEELKDDAADSHLIKIQARLKMPRQKNLQRIR